jgi:hypothetical protein
MIKRVVKFKKFKVKKHGKLKNRDKQIIKDMRALHAS